MGDQDGRSRRALLQMAAASGSVLMGGCSVVSLEGEETETHRTPTADSPQNGSKPAGDGDGLDRSTVALEKVGEGFVAPTQFREPAGGIGQQYVADQTGTVHTLTADGVRDEPFLDVSEQLVPLGEDLPEWAVNEERGLLGLEFHPNYADNRKFYVRYSAPTEGGTPEDVSHIERLSEFRARSDFSAADPDSEKILLTVQMPLPIHQAGAIRFGPDGYLYVAMGDGGAPQSAQNVDENLLGGVLRIDVDTRNGPYGIPDDNPLVDRTGRDEFFAWGFRNPWRISFDGSDLYVADVGSGLYEEINVVESGGNYGWPVKEGSTCIELQNTQGQPTECPEETSTGVEVDSLRDPVIQYPHGRDGEVIGFAVVGGYVYRGEQLPALRGTYVFGDYSSSYDVPRGSLFVADPTRDRDFQMTELTVTNAEGEDLGRSVLSLGQGRDNELYVLTSKLPPSEATDFSRQTGEVYKIVPPGQAETTVREPT